MSLSAEDKELLRKLYENPEQFKEQLLSAAQDVRKKIKKDPENEDLRRFAQQLEAYMPDIGADYESRGVNLHVGREFFDQFKDLTKNLVDEDEDDEEEEMCRYLNLRAVGKEEVDAKLPAADESPGDVGEVEAKLDDETPAVGGVAAMLPAADESPAQEAFPPTP